MGFSRQECWSGLPCPPSGDLPDSGIEPTSLMSPALAGGFFTTSATWEAQDALFFLPLYFELILDLEKSCKDSTKSFLIGLTRVSQTLTLFNLLYNHIHALFVKAWILKVFRRVRANNSYKSYQPHLTGEKTKAQKNKHFTQIPSQCHSRSLPVHQRVTCELRLCPSRHFALHPALSTELGT